VKTFNRRIAAAAIVGLVLSPAIAFGQVQPMGTVARAPLDITELYVMPVLKPGLTPTNRQLLTADPLKDIAAPIALPLILARPIPPVCAGDVACQ